MKELLIHIYIILSCIILITIAVLYYKKHDMFFPTGLNRKGKKKLLYLPSLIASGIDFIIFALAMAVAGCLDLKLDSTFDFIRKSIFFFPTLLTYVVSLFVKFKVEKEDSQKYEDYMIYRRPIFTFAIRMITIGFVFAVLLIVSEIVVLLYKLINMR